jgi:hypothetical protein
VYACAVGAAVIGLAEVEGPLLLHAANDASAAATPR